MKRSGWLLLLVVLMAAIQPRSSPVGDRSHSLAGHAVPSHRVGVAFEPDGEGLRVRSGGRDVFLSAAGVRVLASPRREFLMAVEGGAAVAPVPSGPARTRAN